METAQAQLSQELSKQKSPLPLKPDQSGKHVLTYFWWGNFNSKKENLKGCIHTTHGIAFQEKSEHSTSVRNANSITPSGKKTVKFKLYNLPVVNVNPKSAPSKIPCDVVIQNEKKRRTFSANISY